MCVLMVLVLLGGSLGLTVAHPQRAFYPLRRSPAMGYNPTMGTEDDHSIKVGFHPMESSHALGRVFPPSDRDSTSP
jgi:hypothetical protein